MTEITARTIAQGQLEIELNIEKPEWYNVIISQGHFEAIQIHPNTYYVDKAGDIFQQRGINPWSCYDCGTQVTRERNLIYCPKCRG